MSATRTACQETACWCHDPAWDTREAPHFCSHCGCRWDEPAPVEVDPLACPNCGQQAGSVELYGFTASWDITAVDLSGEDPCLTLGPREFFEVDDGRGYLLCCHSCYQTWEAPFVTLVHPEVELAP